MKFELCTLCYNYQRRWIWQLSSIVQQNYIPDGMCVSVASIGMNGYPSTNDVIDSFQGLHIKLIDYGNIVNFPVRGYIRDEQIKNSNADWLIFIDPDHILHPDFFIEIEKELEIHGDKERVFSIYGKITTDKFETQNIIKDNNSIYINKAYEAAKNIKLAESQSVRRLAGGCLQIVNRDLICRKTGGKYAVNGISRDRHLFKQKTPDDARFRSIIGGSFLFKKCNPPIHLNHYRRTDKEYNPDSQK